MRGVVGIYILSSVLGVQAAVLRGYAAHVQDENVGMCSYSATCSAGGVTGACVSIGGGCCHGTVTSNLCPGSDDIKCCTNNPCSTPSGSGSCMQTSLCASRGGHSVAGYCSGPSDLQCCVGGGGGCSPQATCNAGGVEGVCVSIGSGCCGGAVTSNLCPGSDDIRCCTNNPCSTPSGSGNCMQTSLCAAQGGHSVAGYCMGPNDLQCCVHGGGSSQYGVDISSLTSTSAFSCMQGSGYSFAIPRGYQSNGVVDANVCGNLINAQAGGIGVRDVYLFPCPTCGKSASTQMSELVNHLRSSCSSAWSGRVWLDIEGSQYWTGNYENNKSFYQQLVNACGTYGVSCGVYASMSQWMSIFGSSSYTYGNNLPLWYAHYDNNPSFSDFSSFGGWSSPHAKQFAGTTSLCGGSVDKNYSPAF